MLDTAGKTMIRASLLPSYADCARRAALTVIPDEIKDFGFDLRETPRGVGASIGTSMHEVAAYSMSNKIATGELGSAEEAEQRALAKFEEIKSTEGIEYDSHTLTYDRAQKQLCTLTEVYRGQLAPLIQPVEVEKRLFCDLGDGFYASGQFDVREISTIRDLKTGAASRAHISQYGLYFILCAVNERPAANIIEDWLPRSKDPKPEHFEYDVHVAARAARSIIRRIKADIAEFRATQEPSAFIANPQSMLCGDKFCPAWGTKFCREHKMKGENHS